MTPTTLRRSAGGLTAVERLTPCAARCGTRASTCLSARTCLPRTGGRHSSVERCCVSTGSPVLRFRGEGWDDVLARTSHNTRGQVRRRERKLRREHDVRFRLADDRARLDDDLDTLFGFHTARWQGSPTRFSEGQAIHREFAHAAFDRGWLRLWILEVDGSPVSAWYGFRFGRAESYYQAGRNPAWDRDSVGFVLLVHSIRAALEDGAREYRFLKGRAVQVPLYRRRPRTGDGWSRPRKPRRCGPSHDLCRTASRGCWPLPRLSLFQPPSDQHSR